MLLLPPRPLAKKNDVFLNFRGVDARDGFTNYFYEALRRKSIETFMDEVGIEKGEEIWPKLAKTIRDSLIFVAIFSKEYASSKWCLRELVEIMKSGQTVIPVFYKVTVHDVRHQEGSFKDGFDRLEKEFQQNLEKEQVDSANVDKRKIKIDEEKWYWRQALKAACDLKGWPYENGPELKVIDKIVKDISEKLMRACKLSPCDFEGLFGFEERFKKRAPKLKWIFLGSCPYLTKVSNHLDAQRLEKIDIAYCESFGGFTSHDRFPSLREIYIQDCHNFLGFTSRARFPSLTHLCLKGCNKLTQISGHIDAPSLEKIDTKHCYSFLGFTPHDHFPSLTYLHLKGCYKLTTISECLDAPSLEQIDIESCNNLLHFPPPAQHFNKLREVRVRRCKNLNLIWCQRLQSLPSIIHYPSLIPLTLHWCHKPIKISGLFYAPSLEVIDICGCSALLEFSSPVDLVFNNLREVRVTCCENLQSFGKNIHFPSLVSVHLSRCDSLTELADFLDAPSLEMISLDGCSSLRQFPRPSQHFNNLRRLELSFCKDLRSFPSDIHFPSLTYLSFSSCINLKMLYMSNTATHEVPSTIESSICQLKALKLLSLRNCSALKCFPEILDTMGSLEYLFLDGTAIRGLPHSVENLSGLETLTLRDCKNLEMIPTGIYNLKSLRRLNLSGCSKLENLPGNLVTDLSNCGEPATTKPPSWRLDGCLVDFANCLKLDKTAVINIIELQINQHRDITTKGCETQAVNLRYLYPGSEVPGWFNRQTNGSSINIQMSDHDGVNGHLIGFASCAVIEGCYSYFQIGYGHHCYCKNPSDWKGNPIVFSCGNETSTEHVALWYSNAPVLQLCGQCTTYLFEFCLFNISRTNCRVKYCGVCPIYEKHNITLPSIAYETCGAAIVSVKEHGKIRKFSDEAETSGRSNEDVIEPNPKRTYG